MFKKQLLLLSCLVGFSNVSIAVCELPLKDSNSLIFPSTVTAGSNWWGGSYITNVSDVPVKVTINLTDVNGGGYVPSTVYYSHNFSSANTPFNTTEGAILQPGELGLFNIGDTTDLINIGYVNWSADSCIEHALMVTHYNYYSTSSRYSNSKFHLNNGLPF